MVELTNHENIRQHKFDDLFGSFLKEVSMSNWMSSSFYIILNARRAVYCVLVACGYNYPILVLTINAAMSVGSMIYYVVCRVFLNTNTLVLYMAGEIALTITFVGVLCLYIFEDKYSWIEYVIMAANISFLILGSLINIVTRILQMLKKRHGVNRKT